MKNYDFSVERKSNTEIKRELNKKTKEILRNVPSIIAAVILFAVVLMTFADFKFSNIFTVGFAAKSVMFVMASYVMYYTQKILGKRNGSLDPLYLEKKREHTEKAFRAVEGDENDMPEFCEWWPVWEREKTQKRILSGTGIKAEELKRYEVLGKLVALVSLPKRKLEKLLSREKITEEEYRLIQEVKQMPGENRLAVVRAVLVTKRTLSPYDIISESSDREGRDKAPRRLRAIEKKNDLFSLVPLTVMMLGTLTIVPEVVGVDFGLKTLLYGLLRVVSILVTAFKGNYNGETLYTVDAVENLIVQCNMLDLFEVWRKKKHGENSNHADLRADAIRTGGDGGEGEFLRRSEEAV